jgi:hypothetical protein
MSENINFDNESTYDLVLDREYKNNIPKKLEKFSSESGNESVGIIICIILIIIIIFILVNY